MASLLTRADLASPLRLRTLGTTKQFIGTVRQLCCRVLGLSTPSTVTRRESSAEGGIDRD